MYSHSRAVGGVRFAFEDDAGIHRKVLAQFSLQACGLQAFSMLEIWHPRNSKTA